MSPEASPEASKVRWSALFKPEWLPLLAVLLGGVLLHSMNVMMLATVLPSIVEEVGGATLMSWPTTAFLASSIVAATCTGHLTSQFGARSAFAVGALVFGAGALICALAPSMGFVVVGRFVQGFGGGVLSAMAYVLVGNAFPEHLWPRVGSLLSGVWSLSILIGPLVGGTFATWGNWRGSFYAVTIAGAVLAIFALRSLPRARGGSGGERDGKVRRVPVGRVALICAAIAVMSAAGIAGTAAAKASLFAAAIAVLMTMLALDRRSKSPLFPSDAFSLRSVTGVALWFCLLVSVAYSPLSIFVPIFLQALHGFDPLGAGYLVAGASLGWTVAAVSVAGLPTRWSDRMMVLGPFAMAAGLAGIALFITAQPVAALPPLIVLTGLGIGVCWVFGVQGIMSGAKPGERDLASGSVATVQQTGFALGAAASGIVANMAGLSGGLTTGGIASAAFWVPLSFVAVALVAAVTGWRLVVLSRRKA